MLQDAPPTPAGRSVGLIRAADPAARTEAKAADPIAAIFAVLPKHRIGHLLVQRREQSGVSRVQAARAARLKIGQLKLIEAGEVAPEPSALAALLARYGVDPATFVPPRRRLKTGALDPNSVNQALEAFIGAVRDWRGSPSRGPLRFRHDDVLALVAVLGTEPAAIEAKLIELTGCSTDEAGVLRRQFLRTFAVITAGTAAAAATGMALGSEPAAAATVHRARPKPAKKPQVARPAVRTSKPAVATSTLVGVLQTSTLRTATSYAAGVRSAVVAVHWSQFEPTEGTIDASYVSYVRGVIAKFRAAGMKIVLSPGLEGTPSWVFDLSPTSRFVDQYGTVWQGSAGANVPDPVFDSAVRRAQLNYLAQLGAALRADPIDAVRAGGLCFGELRYPSAGYHNSYWAFSKAAQAQSPVAGWRPGSSGTTQASTFVNWYLASLNSYQNVLVKATMSAFANSRVMVLYPSWGVRPGQVAQAVAGRLSGSSPAEKNGNLQQGLDFASLVGSVPAGATVYTTNLAAPNQGTGVSGQAPIYYLQSLAAARGLPAGGENAGEQTEANLVRCVERAHSLGLTDMLWMNENALYTNQNPPGPTLSQFSAAVASLTVS